LSGQRNLIGDWQEKRHQMGGGLISGKKGKGASFGLKKPKSVLSSRSTECARQEGKGSLPKSGEKGKATPS